MRLTKRPASPSTMWRPGLSTTFTRPNRPEPPAGRLRGVLMLPLWSVIDTTRHLPANLSVVADRAPHQALHRTGQATPTTTSGKSSTVDRVAVHQAWILPAISSPAGLRLTPSAPAPHLRMPTATQSLRTVRRVPTPSRPIPFSHKTPARIPPSSLLHRPSRPPLSFLLRLTSLPLVPRPTPLPPDATLRPSLRLNLSCPCTTCTICIDSCFAPAACCHPPSLDLCTVWSCASAQPYPSAIYPPGTSPSDVCWCRCWCSHASFTHPCTGLHRFRPANLSCP